MWSCVGTCNEQEAVVHGISVVKLVTTKPSTTASMNKNHAAVKLMTDNTLQPTLV